MNTTMTMSSTLASTIATTLGTTLGTNTTPDFNTTIITTEATPNVTFTTVETLNTTTVAGTGTTPHPLTFTTMTETTTPNATFTTTTSLPTECGALVDWISANEKPFQLKFPDDPKFDRRCNLPKPDKPAGECPIVCADGFVADDRDTVTMKCKCDDESGCTWREPKRVLSCIKVTTPESTSPVSTTTTTVPLETTTTAECVVPDWQGTKTEGLMVNGETVYTKIRIKKQSFKKFSGKFSKKTCNTAPRRCTTTSTRPFLVSINFLKTEKSNSRLPKMFPKCSSSFKSRSVK